MKIKQEIQILRNSSYYTNNC